MLQIVGGPTLLQDDYAIRHQENGMDELTFTISEDDPNYPLLLEGITCLIETTENQRYMVQKVNCINGIASITAPLDLSDWCKDVVRYNITYFSRSTATLDAGDLLDTIMNVPSLSRWSRLGVVTTDACQVTLTASPLEIVKSMPKMYGDLTIRFSVINKTINVFNPSFQRVQEILTLSQEKNLRSLPQMKANSSDVITRIYPLGKNGLSIRGASDNPYSSHIDPRAFYVQNTAATNGRVISTVWRDDRYTDANELYHAALEQLARRCRPTRSWKLDVVDLRRINPERSGNELELAIGIPVLLLDPVRKTSDFGRIVSDLIYPYYPEKNQVTFSTAVDTLQQTVATIAKEIESGSGNLWAKIHMYDTDTDET